MSDLLILPEALKELLEWDEPGTNKGGYIDAHGDYIPAWLTTEYVLPRAMAERYAGALKAMNDAIPPCRTCDGEGVVDTSDGPGGVAIETCPYCGGWEGEVS